MLTLDRPNTLDARDTQDIQSTQDADEDAYDRKLQARLDAWDAQIEHLQAKIDILLAHIEEDYYSQMRELRHKEKAVRAGLRRLECIQEDARDEVRAEIKKAVSEMEAALSQAVEQIG